MQNAGRAHNCLELKFARLVPEEQHAGQRAESPTQAGQGDEGSFRNAPLPGLGAVFIGAPQGECDQVEEKVINQHAVDYIAEQARAFVFGPHHSPPG